MTVLVKYPNLSALPPVDLVSTAGLVAWSPTLGELCKVTAEDIASVTGGGGDVSNAVHNMSTDAMYGTGDLANGYIRLSVSDDPNSPATEISLNGYANQPGALGASSIEVSDLDGNGLRLEGDANGVRAHVDGTEHLLTPHDRSTTLSSVTLSYSDNGMEILLKSLVNVTVDASYVISDAAPFECFVYKRGAGDITITGGNPSDYDGGGKNKITVPSNGARIRVFSDGSYMVNGCDT